MINKKYKIKDKLILITGASSGIGKSTAIEFSKKNCKLALTGRNKNKLSKLKNSLIRDAIDVEVFPTKLDSEKDCKTLIKNVEDYFNDSVDVLINCAGLAILGMVQDVPVKDYKKNLSINFFTPLSLIKNIIPGMIKKKSGQIICLFSGVGKRGLPGISPYCVSKFALNGFIESLRTEVYNNNIDVIMISPGLVKTNFHKNAIIHGDLKETFSSGSAKTAEAIAREIVDASVKRKREVILSWKTYFGIHVNYWFPKILDKYLNKKQDGK